MFYVLCDADSGGAFWIMDDDGAPQAFETEEESIDGAKEYNTTSLILKTVARVTERITHKVEKIK